MCFPRNNNELFTLYSGNNCWIIQIEHKIIIKYTPFWQKEKSFRLFIYWGKNILEENIPSKRDEIIKWLHSKWENLSTSSCVVTASTCEGIGGFQGMSCSCRCTKSPPASEVPPLASSFAPMLGWRWSLASLDGAATDWGTADCWWNNVESFSMDFEWKRSKNWEGKFLIHLKFQFNDFQ